MLHRRVEHSRAAVEVVLFDLFGTVVHFVPRVPSVQAAGAGWRSAMGWLREAAESEVPEVDFDDLLGSLLQVTEEIVRHRPPEYREVSSRERFRRALVRCGLDDQGAIGPAERLSLAHMAHLASRTVVPAGHLALLEALAESYRLGLVSNFDHGPTARRILAGHGVAHFFEVTVISDEFGRRKPHPAIFDAALLGMGVNADQALFVGDSINDDIVGAHNAHVPVAWLNPAAEPLPSGTPPPQHVIAQLGELATLLA